MTILFCNNGTTTVAGSINNTVTTVIVNAGDGALFPSPTGGDYFVATLYKNDTSELNEIVHVTGKDPTNPDKFTIVRAQENTQGQLWNPGDNFSALITADSLNHFLQQPDGLNTSEIYDGTDVGTANHINVPAVVPAPAAGPQNGMAVIITVNAANTGPVDVVMLGLAALPLLDGLGRPLQGGELALGQRILVVNASNASYIMMNFEPAIGSRAIHVGDDTSATVNQIISTTMPIPPAYAAGMQFNIKVKNTSTGPVVAGFNGLPVLSCLKSDFSSASPTTSSPVRNTFSSITRRGSSKLSDPARSARQALKDHPAVPARRAIREPRVTKERPATPARKASPALSDLPARPASRALRATPATPARLALPARPADKGRAALKVPADHKALPARQARQDPADGRAMAA